MSDPSTERMQCMEVWGGSELTARGVEFGGLDALVYSKPYQQAHAGGDVYYASSCATGRISRLLLADVAGHGKAVASAAADLRTLMRRFVNRLDQTEFVRLLNEQFGALSRQGSSRRQWDFLDQEEGAGSRGPRNLPLGILGGDRVRSVRRGTGTARLYATARRPRRGG